MADNITPPLAATPADTRQQASESLYLSNFEYIRELIYADPATTLEVEQQIAEGIAAHLPSYDGNLTAHDFREWLVGIIVSLTGFYTIRRVCESFARAAIWRTLEHSTEPNKFDDYPETVRELEQEVWCWVYLHQDELRTPGTAKITTRVYERAAVMTKAWMKKQRTRRAAVIRQLYDLPRKSKSDAAEKLAAVMDRESSETAARKAESKEIRAEMKKVGLAA